MQTLFVILAVFLSAALGKTSWSSAPSTGHSSHPIPLDGAGDQRVGETDKRVYTFAVGDDTPPFDIPAQSGNNMGFSVDIIRRVCEKAEKQCAFVRISSYSECWSQEKRTSNGLNNRHWDVCSTWYKTHDRALAYGFFGEFTSEQPAFLFASSGRAINSYDPANHITGYMRTFWLTDSCLRANGMDVKNVRLFDDPKSFLDALKNRQIDVAFLPEGIAVKSGGLRKISSQIKCAISGNSMMVRKDDLPHFAWYDPVLKDVMESSYYKWACNIAKRAYGGNPFCLN